MSWCHAEKGLYVKEKNTYVKLWSTWKAVNLSIIVQRGNLCDTQIYLLLWGQVFYTGVLTVGVQFSCSQEFCDTDSLNISLPIKHSQIGIKINVFFNLLTWYICYRLCHFEYRQEASEQGCETDLQKKMSSAYRKRFTRKLKWRTVACQTIKTQKENHREKQVNCPPRNASWV